MNDTVMILGSSGYVGSAVLDESIRLGLQIAPRIRWSNFADWSEGVRSILESHRPDVVINCAAYIPTPSVDLCKDNMGATLESNVWLPNFLAQRCRDEGIPLIHCSTACLFDETKEYSESDEPIRGWDGYCGSYVGTKLAGEEYVSHHPQNYILRLRLPFDNVSSPRNYLNKMIAYPRIFDHLNSLTHRGDFAKAAIQLWQNKAEFGTYHVACEGQISNRDVISKLMKKGLLTEQPEFIPGNCTGCRLSTKKLADSGVKLRSVEEAVDDAIENWKA